ncbi:MAG: type II/IV secretion system protein, partial [Gammaproteobacteria bacterium]|nr:type II/IV secretion system protein [Gammaproteobacteria bacterium]
MQGQTGNIPEQDTKLRLGWILSELRSDGLISRQQFEKLVFVAQREGSATDRHPLVAVADQNWTSISTPPQKLDLEQLTRWMADKIGMPYLRIDPLKIEVGIVTKVVSLAYASRFHFLPVEVSSDIVTVATTEPFMKHWVGELSGILRMEIRRVLANPVDIERFREEFYRLSKSVTGATQSSTATPLSTIGNFEQLIELGKSGEPDTNDQHIVRVVDWLFQYAFEQRASDIHLEPRRDSGNIRFRIDGVLHLVHELPPPVLAAVTSRLKAIGRMNVVEKRRPQDGRVKTKSPGGKEVEMRISTMPTAFGEKLVARIFDPDVLVKGFAKLGFSEHDRKRWEHMVDQPYGMILVTGPTGSGKTTTLYSALKHLAKPEYNVCTIEDPIEMVDPQLNQMHVQHNIGLDFASGVRTLLRQDPDIIMIGEIRDRETAETAIQAALTGHLVLSTLHTNDAPSAITRLLDLRVPPYLINGTLLGIVAQRLVRSLCSHCKISAEINPNQWQAMVTPMRLRRPEKTFGPSGCDECRSTGFMGRSGIYEILTMSEKLRRLVTSTTNVLALREQALKEGM